MRNRYVKKCRCDSNPVVTKKTATLRKNVLDIDISVLCPECGRDYKEVPPKRTRMENPEILVEVIDPHKPGESPDYPADTGVEDESNGAGELQQNTESAEGNGKKEESPSTPKKEKAEVAKAKDPGRDADEGITEDKVEEEKKKGPGRPRGKAARDKNIDVPVYEQTTEEALEDSGVPEEDLF